MQLLLYRWTSLYHEDKGMASNSLDQIHHNPERWGKPFSPHDMGKGNVFLRLRCNHLHSMPLWPLHRIIGRYWAFKMAPCIKFCLCVNHQTKQAHFLTHVINVSSNIKSIYKLLRLYDESFSSSQPYINLVWNMYSTHNLCIRYQSESILVNLLRECVSVIIIFINSVSSFGLKYLCQPGFKQWLVFCYTPSNFRKVYWSNINWIFEKKFKWNLHRIAIILFTKIHLKTFANC